MNEQNTCLFMSFTKIVHLKAIGPFVRVINNLTKIQDDQTFTDYYLILKTFITFIDR